MEPDPAPHRSLFAIWRWPRWTWAVIVPMLASLYVLSAVPVVRALRHTNLSANTIESLVHTVYFPLVIADRQIPACRDFFMWQDRMLDRFLGTD